MALYLLTRKSKDVGWDEYDSRLVRAQTVEDARETANNIVADEGQIWTNEKLVDCVEIQPVGNREIIISSFNAG